MFVLVVRFRAKKGQEKIIERMIHDMTAKVRREEKDTLLYDLHRKIGDASEFLLYERYTNKPAWEVTHCEKPAFKKLLADLPQYVDGDIDKTEYELIEAK